MEFYLKKPKIKGTWKCQNPNPPHLKKSWEFNFWGLGFCGGFFSRPNVPPQKKRQKKRIRYPPNKRGEKKFLRGGFLGMEISKKKGLNFFLGSFELWFFSPPV